MSKTLRELEAKRATYVVQLGVQENDLRRTRDKFIEDERIILSIIGDYRLEIADLDIAIAALSPTPDFIAEQETAREQLEREPEIPAGFTKWEGGECPVPHGKIVDIICRDPDVRVGQTNQVFAHMISWANEGNAAYDIIAYRIIEAAPVADEQADASEFAEPVEEAPALNEAMQDEREEPVALAQPEWNEPDGYAPVTNPEADTIARAHDYYSPEKMGDRNRSVFDIFRHKREDA